MRHFTDLSGLSKEEIAKIFDLADELAGGKHKGALARKTAVMFFPSSSLRTRVSFERGVYLLGGQSVLFPPETLDKREELRDVAGYLDGLADMVIVRHGDKGVIRSFAENSRIPVINAMTKLDHPCEIMTDMYALTKLRGDISRLKFLFVGAAGNIGNTWKQASEIMGFSLTQCCPEGYELDGVRVHRTIEEAAKGMDIICTDSLPGEAVSAFAPCRVTKAALSLANEGALLNPCPPFFRGEEVSADAIDSEHFVGYGFKNALLNVQQAIMLYCLG